jgi:hypothetical protein
MEIPDLVRQQRGDEEIVSAVNLGDEDLACFTPTRTLLYQGEGILSDDSLDVFDHDVERLKLSAGRRKATFTLEYVDRTEQFSVPKSRTEPVLQRLLDGILHMADVLASAEEVLGVHRFSELLLIITDARLVKHVGAYVWDEDFEEYPYESVTGLSFEDGQVATQIVISVDGRPQRIKAPNDKAPMVKQTLTDALFDYYDVETLAGLNDSIGTDETNEAGSSVDAGTTSSDIEFDESITPLVGDADDDADSGESNTVSQTETLTDPTVEDTADSDGEADGSTGEEQSATTVGSASDSPTVTVDAEELETLQQQLSKLTTAVQRQNELLTQQHETIDQLVEELKNQ